MTRASVNFPLTVPSLLTAKSFWHIVFNTYANRIEVGTLLKIYIAGPYSADTQRQRHENTTKAIDAGLALWKKGHCPYIPHLTHYVDHRAKLTNIPMSWEEYIEWDKAWLASCDALLFLGSSKGAEIELEFAKKLGKTIFFNVNNVPVARKHKGSAVVEYE